MTHIIGLIIVISVVFGGLAISGGPAILSALPFELALIGGAAAGTLLIGNPPAVALKALTGFGQAVQGARWTKAHYQALFSLTQTLLRRAHMQGMIAIERDIEAPEQSALFKEHHDLKECHATITVLCDGLRFMDLDPGQTARLDQRLKGRITSLMEPRLRAAGAMQTLADALPALGIVAAVLGIIKTMGAIDGSTAVLGEMIASALLGTFLGVFLSYGLVAPLAARYTQIVEEEALLADTARAILVSFAEGSSPYAAIELARASLPLHLQPEPRAVTHIGAASTPSARRAA